MFFYIMTISKLEVSWPQSSIKIIVSIPVDIEEMNVFFPVKSADEKIINKNDNLEKKE